MSEDKPNFVTRNPFIYPQRIPVITAARKPAKKFNDVRSKVQENMNPERAITDGNDKSISPAAVIKTKLKPTIVKSGSDKKIAVYIPEVKNTSGANPMKVTNIIRKKMAAPTTGRNLSWR
jgi:hypothetical protein